MDEDNLAFDKCTLLSSQGSDAPAHPPQQGEKRRATSQSYVSPTRPSNPTRRTIKVKTSATPFPGQPLHHITSDEPVKSTEPEPGTTLPGPKTHTTNRSPRCWRWVVRYLEGSQALQAFRSTAWDEQVITYAPPTHPANPHHTPGVSPQDSA